MNEFRKLIVYKVLRPDSYVYVLNEYVNKSLQLSFEQPDWAFVFENPLFKSIVVNMGTQSNVSNSSSMSRIHKNLFLIAAQHQQKITTFNCNFLSLSELCAEIKNVQEGFVLLKNTHLASKDVIDYIKKLCDDINCIFYIFIIVNMFSIFKIAINFIISK